MSDWEDLADRELAAPPPVVVAKTGSKWSKSKSSASIPDSWDALSEDETAAVAPVQETKKKPTAATASTIKAKKSAETPAEQAARLRREVIKSDEKNVADLFSGCSISSVFTAKEPPTIDIEAPAVDVCQIDLEYFDRLSQATVDCLAKVERHGLYVSFLEGLTKRLYEKARVENIRKIASVLGTLANEKQRQAKAASSKKKKPTKQHVKVEKSSTFNHDDLGDDDYVENDYEM